MATETKPTATESLNWLIENSRFDVDKTVEASGHFHTVNQALGDLLEACRLAAILCDEYADGAPDAPRFAKECNRLGGILEEAIVKAT